MKKIIIAAVGSDGVIGVGDGLPWHIPSELSHFKRETVGKVVVFGKNTFLSVGQRLKNRHIIVVSRSYFPNVVTVPSLEAAYEMAEKIICERGLPSFCMIAGGAGLYRDAINSADEMVLTFVDMGTKNLQNSIYFPEINYDIWSYCESTDWIIHPLDQYRYKICRFIRKNSGIE